MHFRKVLIILHLPVNVVPVEEFAFNPVLFVGTTFVIPAEAFSLISALPGIL